LFRLHVSILFIQKVLLCLYKRICWSSVRNKFVWVLNNLSLCLVLLGFLLFPVVFLLGFYHSWWPKCDLCSICTKVAAVLKKVWKFCKKMVQNKDFYNSLVMLFLASDCTMKMGQFASSTKIACWLGKSNWIVVIGLVLGLRGDMQHVPMAMWSLSAKWNS